MQTRQPDLSAYSPDYRLFEEARKSWDYVVSDELVYVGYLDNVQLDNMHVAKQYAQGAGRVEIHLTLHGKRNAHFCAIVRRCHFRDVHYGGRKLKHNIAAGRRDASVLVKVAHLVKAPEKMLLNRIRSIVWLKRFDDLDCICGHTPSVALESIPAVGVVRVVNRELGMLGRRPRLPCQLKDKLIQRGPKTIKQIASNERKPVGDIGKFDLEHVPLALRIVLLGKQMRVAMNEDFVGLPKSVKVFFRPGGLQIGISEADPASSYLAHRLSTSR